MRSVLSILIIAFSAGDFLAAQVLAADPVLPPGDATPLLRLETNGPRNYIAGLAFSPDGKHLYAAGWDKAVQVLSLIHI